MAKRSHIVPLTPSEVSDAVLSVLFSTTDAAAGRRGQHPTADRDTMRAYNVTPTAWQRLLLTSAEQAWALLPEVKVSGYTEDLRAALAEQPARVHRFLALLDHERALADASAHAAFRLGLEIGRRERGGIEASRAIIDVEDTVDDVKEQIENLCEVCWSLGTTPKTQGLAGERGKRVMRATEQGLRTAVDTLAALSEKLSAWRAAGSDDDVTPQEPTSHAAPATGRSERSTTPKARP